MKELMRQEVLFERRLAGRALSRVLAELEQGEGLEDLVDKARAGDPTPRRSELAREGARSFPLPSPLWITFNADDPRVVLPLPSGEYGFSEDWQARGAGEGLARVLLGRRGETIVARVVIPRLIQLVRRNHRSELDLRAMGVERDGRVNDIDVELDLEEVLVEEAAPMLSAPQRRSELQRTRGKPKVHRTLSSHTRRFLAS